MIHIFCDKSDNRISFLSQDIGYQSNGNYLIHNGSLAVPPAIFNHYSVDNVPSDVEPERWCYTPEAGFYANTAWVEPTQTDDGNTITPDEIDTILNGGE